jgi:NAD(P)-dependent dehydrogenase (short-subunit alcohol dehydrogenase family)
MKRSISFADRHVLVTGAASGIGRATALEMARRGASLSLLDIDRAGVEATAEAARALGRRAAAYQVDIADAAAVDEAAARVLAERGAVDVLVNNAGVAVAAPFLRTRAEDWDWIAGVNLWGPLRLTRALLPAMLERRSGQVVMVASLAGLVGAPGMVAYSTTKFAVVGFAETLRLELAGTGVGVTLICPGFVRTNLARATRYDNAGFRRFLDEPPSWYGMKQERVASAIADAVTSRRPLLVLGPEKLGWWLKRAAPEAAFAVTRWVAARTGIVPGRQLPRT